MAPTNETRECNHVDLEFANWSFVKLFIVLIEISINLSAIVMLPILLKDLTTSARLCGYQKLLVAFFVICLWFNQTLRMLQLFVSKALLLIKWSNFYTITLIVRETLDFFQVNILSAIIVFLYMEISCRERKKKICLILLLIFFISSCTAVALHSKLVDLNAKSTFIFNSIFVSLSILFQYHFSSRFLRMIHNPTQGRQDYLVSIQKNLRQASRGLKYTKNQAKIAFALFLIRSMVLSAAYFWVFPRCKFVSFQILLEFSDLINSIYLLTTIINVAHYSGGKLHFFILKVFPSRKIGSTSSTESVYYNTPILNAQDIHFNQLAELWKTYSTPYRVNPVVSEL